MGEIETDMVRQMDELLRLIERELNIEHGSLNERSEATNVEGWDSLAVIRICLAAEERYSLKFTMDEIASSFGSVSAIRDVLQKRSPGLILT